MFKKIAAAFFALAAILAVGRYFLAQQEMSSDEIAKAMVQAINSNAPRMMTDEVRMEKASNVNNRVVHNYTLVGIGPDEIDGEDLKNLVYPSLLEDACSNAEMKDLLNKGVIFGYSYKDNAGKEILHVTLTRSECG